MAVFTEHRLNLQHVVVVQPLSGVVRNSTLRHCVELQLDGRVELLNHGVDYLNPGLFLRLKNQIQIQIKPFCQIAALSSQ